MASVQRTCLLMDTQSQSFLLSFHFLQDGARVFFRTDVLSCSKDYTDKIPSFLSNSIPCAKIVSLDESSRLSGEIILQCFVFCLCRLFFSCWVAYLWWLEVWPWSFWTGSTMLLPMATNCPLQTPVFIQPSTERENSLLIFAVLLPLKCRFFDAGSSECRISGLFFWNKETILHNGNGY